MKEATRSGKRPLVVVHTAGLLWLFLEGLSLTALLLLSYWKGISYEPLQSALSAEQRAFLSDRLQAHRKTGVLERHHPTLGWTNPKAQQTEDGMYLFNSVGIRAYREYSPQPDDCTLRIAAFGDSFTMGAGVRNPETWEEQVSRARGDIEVLNFGVGAYGLDQAYLRYLHDGTTYHADVVILGMMSENVFRNVNVFRPFYNDAYSAELFTKPRFTLNGDALVLQKNPLQTIDDLQRLLESDRKMLAEFGRNDYHYQKRSHQAGIDVLPSVRFGKLLLRSLRDNVGDHVLTRDGMYNVQSEAFHITDRIFDDFYWAALSNHSLPVIMTFPDSFEIRAFRQKQTTRYEPLLERFRAKGYRFIDLMTAFVEAGAVANWKAVSADRWGHYSPSGNMIVARALIRYLEGQHLLSREAVRRAVVAERARLGIRAVKRSRPNWET